MNVRYVAPRVPLVDLRTGLMTREWYLFFQGLMQPGVTEAEDQLLLGALPVSGNGVDAFSALAGLLDPIPAAAAAPDNLTAPPPSPLPGTSDDALLTPPAVTPDGAGVTSVSVTPSNGITASVTTPTTTPAIALGLGNITPLTATIDSGATPAASQLRVRANGLGALSVLAYSPDNVALGFDADYSSGFVARDTTAALIYKVGGFLTFYGDSGLVAGTPYTPTARVNLALSTGKWQFFYGIAANGISATLPGPFATDALAGAGGVASGSFYSRSDGAGGLYVCIKV